MDCSAITTTQVYIDGLMQKQIVRGASRTKADVYLEAQPTLL